MPDVSSTATAPTEEAKLSALEKLAAKEAKNADRAAKKAEVRQAKVAKGTQKKAEGWEDKGRDSNGKKAYDFNANKENGKFVAFDENSVSESRRRKGIKKEEIARDMDTGNAARTRSWAGGIKQKIEFTEERINTETGKREDVRTRKEKKNVFASKNVDYKENGAKTIERGSRKGIFSLTYTNNPDGSRTLNGFKLGLFKINRTKGENGAKSFEIGFGKSLKYSKMTDADGNKTRSYKIGNVYSNSKTVDKKGELVHSEKNYFGKRTKTFEKTDEGTSKYTTKGRSVNEMKRDGMDEKAIKDQINKDVADGKVYRLKRTNEKGEVTRDYNRQSYKGKTSDYVAGDKDTNDTSKKSAGWGFSTTKSQRLSREQMDARDQRKSLLESETLVASTPGAFPKDYSEADKRIIRNLASSKVAQINGAADAKGNDAMSVSSVASGKSSIASFATASTSAIRSIVSGKGSVNSTDSTKTSRSDVSGLSTATTATANTTQTKLQTRLDERSRDPHTAPSL
jgi:hypothetical protein